MEGYVQLSSAYRIALEKHVGLPEGLGSEQYLVKNDKVHFRAINLLFWCALLAANIGIAIILWWPKG